MIKNKFTIKWEVVPIPDRTYAGQQGYLDNFEIRGNCIFLGVRYSVARKVTALCLWALSNPRLPAAARARMHRGLVRDIVEQMTFDMEHMLQVAEKDMDEKVEQLRQLVKASAVIGRRKMEPVTFTFGDMKLQVSDRYMTALKPRSAPQIIGDYSDGINPVRRGFLLMDDIV